jgi:hypothetical protein
MRKDTRSEKFKMGFKGGVRPGGEAGRGVIYAPRGDADREVLNESWRKQLPQEYGVVRGDGVIQGV